MARIAPYAVGGAMLGVIGGVSLGLGAWWAAWIVWLAYFAIVECVALARSRTGDTLSEHVWMWFAIGHARPISAWVRLRRFALLAFMAWLMVHFLTGGWV